MRTRIVLVSFLLAATAARAQVNPLGLEADVSKQAPRFYGLQLDYTAWFASNLNAENYTASFSHYIEPRWNFGKLLFRGTRAEGLRLAGRLVVNNPVAGYDELGADPNGDLGRPTSCSNLTPGPTGQIDPALVQRCNYDIQRRTYLNDIWLTLSAPGLVPNIPKADITVTPSLRWIIPASPSSLHYTHLQSGITANVALARNFMKKLTVSYIFGATKFFNKYTVRVPDAEVSATGKIDTNYDTNQILQSGLPREGSPNTSFNFTHFFIASYTPIPKLSFDLYFILINAFAYDDSGGCGVANYGGVMTDPCANAAALNGGKVPGRAHTDTQVFWLAAGYEVLDWLTLSVAWINAAPLRKDDNSYRQPFISTNYDGFTQVSLSATVSIDGAAKKLFK